MHDHALPVDAADFEPLFEATRRVVNTIADTAVDQKRPGSPYLKNPPLTMRERAWVERASLALRLLDVLAASDGEDVLSPSLDTARIALRAITDDAARAVLPRA